MYNSNSSLLSIPSPYLVKGGKKRYIMAKYPSYSSEQTTFIGDWIVRIRGRKSEKMKENKRKYYKST